MIRRLADTNRNHAVAEKQLQILKMVFYKSGKFTIETYKDNDVSEFNIDEIINK